MVTTLVALGVLGVFDMIYKSVCSFQYNKELKNYNIYYDEHNIKHSIEYYNTDSDKIRANYIPGVTPFTEELCNLVKSNS